MRSLQPSAAAAVLVLCARPVAAQIASFTLVDDDVRYSVGGLSGNRLTSAGGSGANLETNILSTPTDHLFQEWFWYRAGADTREYALSNQVTGSASTNHARLVYEEPANNGATAAALRADLEFTLSDLSTGGGGIPIAVIAVSFTLRNLTAASLPVNFFAYADIDLAGGNANDTARIDGVVGQTIRVRDDVAARPTAGYAVASATSHAGFQIGAFPTIRDALSDAGLNNLTNAATTFGPGDVTCAHQWAATLAAAGNQADTLTGSFLISITVGADTCTLPDIDGNGHVQPADIALFVNKWLAALSAGCP